ncbi:MAG: type I-D CRISPR-associated protein Cas7/Csc2 [Chloroflexi bacterium]|nr:type I-D CRISPR-associated protein Cas7/Csc2 [Chloroflexota bacterium]
MLNTTFFAASVPPRPTGRYAHLILLRETDSYALFQTDGELNTARVHAGVGQSELLTRITMFKRKQTTPERLIGRELLRRYGFISTEPAPEGKERKGDERGVLIDGAGLPICDYNVEFCKQCPDCIAYGFAIGDAGSEKSKVYSDTAYSLSAFDVSHEAFTLNAPYEGGTMSRKGEVTSRINEQDHVRPQTLFPAVITVRDLTVSLFLYVLNNVLRTRRYGAQTTRTGTMTNHVIGIVLADGEIFSNLHFTQRIYDHLAERSMIDPAQPIALDAALNAAREVATILVKEDQVAVSQHLQGTTLANFLTDFSTRTRDEAGMHELLQAATRDSAAYHSAYIQKKGKK